MICARLGSHRNSFLNFTHKKVKEISPPVGFIVDGQVHTDRVAQLAEQWKMRDLHAMPLGVFDPRRLTNAENQRFTNTFALL